MTTATAGKIHPFEAAGLGVAPFRCTGVHVARMPVTGQPAGTCDFCGTGIADCYEIKSSDGRAFVVGSDCVARTLADFDASLSAEVRKLKAQADRMKRAARREARWAKLSERAATDVRRAREALAAHPRILSQVPHPSIKGKTLRDYAEWMMENAGVEQRLYWADQVLREVPRPRSNEVWL